MRSIVPFVIGSAAFALDALAVLEVAGERPWVPLPFAPRGAPGVASWRGRAIALVDVGALLSGGHSLAPGQVRARTVVARAAGCTVALPVDQVREVHDVAETLVGPAPPGALYASALVEAPGGPVTLLDFEALVEGVLREGTAAA